MVGWHHGLNGHEFGYTLGVGVRQWSLVSCSPWGLKELDTTEWLNWTDLKSQFPSSNSLFHQFYPSFSYTTTPLYWSVSKICQYFHATLFIKVKVKHGFSLIFPFRLVQFLTISLDYRFFLFFKLLFWCLPVSIWWTNLIAYFQRKGGLNKSNKPPTSTKKLLC